MKAYSSDNPLVSIIIPMYNSARYLAETVNSVIAQEYNNWEILLVDDGSVDSTVSIAKEYVARFPGKIFYAEHSGHVNKGASSTRNLGISKASGELVALLDSDDLWMPKKLKEQVEFMVMNPNVNVLSEATLYWNSWSDASADDEVLPLGVPPGKLYKPLELAWKLYPLSTGAAPCMCGIIMKMSAMKNIGGFEDCFTGKDQLYEDQAFAFKIYLHEGVYVSSKCNNIYRQRPDSLMHGIVAGQQYEKGRLFFLNWLSLYLKEKKINNLRIRFLLWKAMLPYKHPTLYKNTVQVWWKYRDRLKPSVTI